MSGGSSPALLPACLRAWCAHEATKLLYTFWYGPPIGVHYCLSVAAVLAAAARPSRRTAILALLLRIWDSLERMPIMWDSYYWCLQTDVGLLLLLLFPGAGDETGVALSWAEIVRSQLVPFYAAAAFFKINTAFLDHRYSCAPIFFMTLLPTLGLPLQPQHAEVIARLAPAVTIAGEFAICTLLATRRTFRYGVVLALLLHLGIALTPPPNNATPFSLACAVRLLVLMPRGLHAAAAEVADGSAAGRITAALAFAASAICTRVAYARQLYHPPAPATPTIDWWVALYAVLAVLCCRAAAIEELGGRTRRGGEQSAHQPPSTPIRTPLAVLATLYAFVGPILGTQDLGACNMYSNLRAHGGSNHLLVPTLLLGRMVPEATWAGAFAIVRVEACSSESINAIYPGEISAHMADDERTLLRGVGQNGRMFNGAKAIILTPASTPGPNGAGGRPFVRYTVPALELRRLLAEARAANESFSMTYTVLDGASGDEAWRRHGTGRTVRVEEDGRGGASCAVVRGGLFAGSDECAPTELARMPPPGPLVRKLLLQQSYPIVDDDGGEEMPCFGP